MLTALAAMALLCHVVYCQVDADADPQCSTQIRIPLLFNDLNGIKSVPVCTQREDCYLTYLFDAIEDKMFNSLQENLTGQLVLNYTRDQRAPQLVSFTSINFDNGTIRLLFNEVRCRPEPDLDWLSVAKLAALTTFRNTCVPWLWDVFMACGSNGRFCCVERSISHM